MKTKKQNVDDISRFVLDFIEKNKDGEDLGTIVKKWNNPKNKTALKQIVNVKKTGKDPEKPKKIETAYLLYCKDIRAKTTSDNPDLNNKEIVSAMAEKWKIIKEKNNKEYKKYIEQYNKNKEDYLKRLEEYKKSKEIAEEIEETPKPIRKKKEIVQPKSKKKKEDYSSDNSEEYYERRERVRERTPESDHRTPDSDRSRTPEPPKEKNIYSGDEYEAFFKKKEKKVRKSHPELSDEEVFKKVNKKWKKQIKN